MAGIYIHIPFCRALCHYCSFHFSLSEQRKEQMALAILKELEQERDFFDSSQTIETLYIGGGTPTLYAPEVLQSFIDKVKELWGVSSFREVTIEANPDDLTPEYLEKLSHTSCNRLSIGVQSFDDDILKLINRRHNGSEAVRAIENARKFGFSNITMDLIYGIPSQSLESLKRDLDIAISLAPEHLSAYHLTIEKGSIFATMERKGAIKAVDESVSELHFKIVSEALQKSGYEHYEISNFAKKSFMATHNSNYWGAKPYLGVGPSAHSFDGENIRRWNFSSNPRYLRAIEGGEVQFEQEVLTSTNRLNEDVMTMLRTAKGVDLKYIESVYGKESLDRVVKDSAKYIEIKELVIDGNYLYIPCEHFLKSDFIISELFV